MSNMKKLLSAFAIFSVSGTVGATVVACDTSTLTVDLATIQTVEAPQIAVTSSTINAVSKDIILNTMRDKAWIAVQQIAPQATQGSFDVTVSVKIDNKMTALPPTVDLSKPTSLFVQISAKSTSDIIKGKTAVIEVKLAAATFNIQDLAKVDDVTVPIPAGGSADAVAKKDITTAFKSKVEAALNQLSSLKVTDKDYSFSLFVKNDEKKEIALADTVDLTKITTIDVQISANESSKLLSGATDYITVNVNHKIDISTVTFGKTPLQITVGDNTKITQKEADDAISAIKDKIQETLKNNVNSNISADTDYTVDLSAIKENANVSAIHTFTITSSDKSILITGTNNNFKVNFINAKI